MAYLQITLAVDPQDRPAAAAVYEKYRRPFLTTASGAHSKELLIRDQDVQVLHGFDSVAQAEAYLTSELFTQDIVRELTPLLEADPDVRIFDVVSAR